MHIKTFRHRHALALPLFAAALIGMAATSGSLPLHRAAASVVHTHYEATGANLPVQFDDGTYGLLLEDGKISAEDGLTLGAGTVLLASQGQITMDMEDLAVRGFHGAFQVTRDGDKAIIAALTTPVLVRLGESIFVIPAGMAGEQRLRILQASPTRALEDILAVQMIPQEVLTEQLQRLQPLTPGALPSLEDESLRAFQSALRNGNRAAAQQLLHMPEFQALLTADVLPVLLADVADMPSVAGELMGYLGDEDLWLTLSFHRDYRAPAFGSSGPLSLSAEARRLRWLQFPQSDILADEASLMTVTSWSKQVQLALAAMEAPQTFLNDLLRVLAQYHDLAEAKGWVERVRHYRDEILQIATPYRDQLSQQSAVMLNVWEDIDDIPLYTEPDPDPDPEPDPDPDPEIPPTAAEAVAAVDAATELLRQAGALFTIQTAFTATTADQVAVDGILFATANDQRAFRFTLTISTQQLSGIEDDGQLMPFPMSLTNFVLWLRK